VWLFINEHFEVRTLWSILDRSQEWKEHYWYARSKSSAAICFYFYLSVWGLVFYTYVHQNKHEKIFSALRWLEISTNQGCSKFWLVAETIQSIQVCKTSSSFLWLLKHFLSWIQLFLFTIGCWECSCKAYKRAQKKSRFTSLKFELIFYCIWVIAKQVDKHSSKPAAQYWHHCFVATITTYTWNISFEFFIQFMSLKAVYHLRLEHQLWTFVLDRYSF